MANFSFIDTQRHGQMLIVENFAFRVNRKQPTGRRYWKCITSTCKATAITDGHNVVRACTGIAHNHPSNEVELKHKQFKNDVKDQVTNYSLLNIIKWKQRQY